MRVVLTDPWGKGRRLSSLCQIAASRDLTRRNNCRGLTLGLLQKKGTDHFVRNHTRTCSE